jgi:lysyl-tRNA synthetase class 1
MKELRSWPFKEAQKLLNYLERSGKLDKEVIVFETGYGPSGLPHIGTFCEVMRTTFVRKAFEHLSGKKTKLICFSDDMDGMRKVPPNLPNQEMLFQHIGKPLTSVPDPFGKKESFGHYMNSKLRSFLDSFELEYEFYSATECYKSGMFDDALLKALNSYQDIMDIMLPTLRDERRATYSPFMPICEDTGIVLQVPTIKTKAKTIVYKNAQGTLIETPVTGGKCKLQWKPDFAMRWATLGIDYEMYGKDHMSNSKIYSDICKVFGGKPPHQYFFELFLDENGEKISKTKGNSITIDHWLQYAPIESLGLYVYKSPERAKRLHFDVIPQNTDEYISWNKKYHEIFSNTNGGDTENSVSALDNPAWHVSLGKKTAPIHMYNLNFALLLNIASACNTESKEVLWGFIKKYSKEASPEKDIYLDQLSSHAVKYYKDFIPEA